MIIDTFEDMFLDEFGNERDISYRFIVFQDIAIQRLFLDNFDGLLESIRKNTCGEGRVNDTFDNGNKKM